jgi:hypothetical protein
VSAETSLKLVPCDAVDVHMGIAVCLPPIGRCPIELLCGTKDLLTICALGDHEFLFNPLEPIFCIHGVFGLLEGGGRVRKNSAKRDWWGCGGGGACCWLGCILLRVCSIACISCFWVLSNCSRLAVLVLFLLGWPLHWLFLVFTI